MGRPLRAAPGGPVYDVINRANGRTHTQRWHAHHHTVGCGHLYVVGLRFWY